LSEGILTKERAATYLDIQNKDAEGRTEGVGLRVKNEGGCVFRQCPFDMDIMDMVIYDYVFITFMFLLQLCISGNLFSVWFIHFLHISLKSSTPIYFLSCKKYPDHFYTAIIGVN
jgi:hypothetical protein